jgi:hypothetical protein
MVWKFSTEAYSSHGTIERETAHCEYLAERDEEIASQEQLYLPAEG